MRPSKVQIGITFGMNYPMSFVTLKYGGGRRGSLMHLISSRGLYDNQGISYIDGSFNHLILPGN